MTQYGSDATFAESKTNFVVVMAILNLKSHNGYLLGRTFTGSFTEGFYEGTCFYGRRTVGVLKSLVKW